MFRMFEADSVLSLFWCRVSRELDAESALKTLPKEWVCLRDSVDAVRFKKPPYRCSTGLKALFEKLPGNVVPGRGMLNVEGRRFRRVPPIKLPPELTGTRGEAPE